eukprot:gene9740-13106_t
MAKSRFTTTDVRAMVRDIRSSLLGLRVSNVYNLNDKVYLIKFTIPQNTTKIYLLLESGIRFHTTKFIRDIPDLPSPFTMKIRKFVRTKRLEDIKQLGDDRVIDFKFGSGDAVCHIILELYSNGNIVLTDGNYEVISLLRSHQFEDDVTLRVNEIYPIAFTTNLINTITNTNKYNSSSNDNNDNANVNSSEHDVNSCNNELKSIQTMNVIQFLEWIHLKLDQQSDYNNAILDANNNIKKKKPKMLTLRQLFLLKDSGISSYGPDIIDHCITSSDVEGIKPNIKVDQLLSKFDENDINKLLLVIQSNCSLIWSTIDPYIQFNSFDEAVDLYFCKIEEQKLTRYATQAEAEAKKKIEKVKNEHNKLLKSLEKQQLRMEKNAMLLELYAENVDKVILVINSALNSGMAWNDISDMVDMEKENGNPVAMMVSRLRLERNHIILQLIDIMDEDDIASDHNEDDEDVDEIEKNVSKRKDIKSKNNKIVVQNNNKNNIKMVEVEIDLSLSAYANARNMYNNKKVAQSKEAKTVAISTRVLQSVEEQATKSLEKQQIKKNLQTMRKIHWFEKFNWFISLEGYLILSGRDAQQNELLFKKYLRPSDLYVHADISGASSCIIRAKDMSATSSELSIPSKNKKQSLLLSNVSSFNSISPIAIQEAGVMAVCRSSAWSAKVITSAWWVYANQVSKSAPSGEYLTTGSFMIYGKKNFLPPMSLEMGYGIMFRLDDSCVTKHMNDRKDRAGLLTDNDDLESVLTDNFDRYSIDYNAADSNTIMNTDLSDSQVSTSNNHSKNIVNNNNNNNNKNDKKLKSKNNDKRNKNKIILVKNNDMKEKVEVIVNQDLFVIAEGNDNNDSDDNNSDDENNHNNNNNNINNINSNKNNKTQNNDKNNNDKKKKMNKKKARRYAEQDEEDRELAMLLIGNAKQVAKQQQSINIKTKNEIENKLEKRKEKAGVTYLKTDWHVLLSQFNDEFREKIQEMVNNHHIREGEIDAHELNTERKKLEKQEIQAILEEEGILDEKDGLEADELMKLTGCPHIDDILLYAVPVCGPYQSLQNFKYKIKLLPGTQKKSKAVKQIMDIFTFSKECLENEKVLMKGLLDTETVAVMIGDVKLSMPGLLLQKKQQQQIKRKNRGQKDTK